MPQQSVTERFSRRLQELRALRHLHPTPELTAPWLDKTNTFDRSMICPPESLMQQTLDCMTRRSLLFPHASVFLIAVKDIFHFSVIITLLSPSGQSRPLCILSLSLMDGQTAFQDSCDFALAAADSLGDMILGTIATLSCSGGMCDKISALEAANSGRTCIGNPPCK